MYNRRFIIPGIIIFVIACLFPFLLNVTAKPYTGPALVLPAGERECVEPAAVMRTEHMRILSEWRDAAVREGKRTYTAGNGKVWEVSLQNTCMRCHTNMQDFCGSCHDANSVSPDCWSCHITPETKNAKAYAVTGPLTGRVMP